MLLRKPLMVLDRRKKLVLFTGKKITYQTLEYRLNAYRCKRISPRIYSYRTTTNWFLPYPALLTARGKKTPPKTNQHTQASDSFLYTANTNLCQGNSNSHPSKVCTATVIFTVFLYHIDYFFSFYNIKTYQSSNTRMNTTLVSKDRRFPKSALWLSFWVLSFAFHNYTVNKLLLNLNNLFSTTPICRTKEHNLLLACRHVQCF